MESNLKLLLEVSQRLEKEFVKNEDDCMLLVGLSKVEMDGQQKAGMPLAFRGEAARLSAAITAAMKVHPRVALAIIIAVDHFLEAQQNPDGEEATRLKDLFENAVKATNAEAAEKFKSL
jgi:hypothetical protein